MYFINYGQMNLRIYKFERKLLVGTASNWKRLTMVFEKSKYISLILKNRRGE